jgi:NADH dehydrogenase FAD-containing subunit
MTGARVVIVVGGFGGAFTSRYLRKYPPRGTRIELLNTTNYFVFQPLLPEVVSGTIIEDAQGHGASNGRFQEPLRRPAATQ